MVSPLVPSERGIFLAHVKNRRVLCREHFQVSLRLDSFPNAEPGQFVQVLCHGPIDESAPSASTIAAPMLRRPFSIAGLRREGEGCEIDLIGRVIGAGTAWLDSVQRDDRVSLLGPLGRPFTHPSVGTHAILVAGGVGLPPIRWLGERLSRSGYACTAIFGAQSRDLIPLILEGPPSPIGAPSPCAAEFSAHGIPASITTDDGTCGMRGRVTDSLSRLLEERGDHDVHVYACGPEPMLNAIGRMCTQRDIRCELALERVMGCGMGTCQSCVVPVRDDTRAQRWRYALCCTEGPIFEARQLLLD